MREVNSFAKGIRDGLPICFGYLSVAFAFGIFAMAHGLNIYETVLMSMTNVTSAGQLAALPIIATGGKQYRVEEGDIIRVEKLELSENDSYTFDQVLALNDGSLKLGNPTVEGATVTATSLGNGRAKKVVVYRYKSKKGYHKKNGHRQAYTEVRIDKINA